MTRSSRPLRRALCIFLGTVGAHAAWAQSCESFTLSGIMERVLTFNPTALSKRSESNAALTDQKYAWMQYLPTPSVSADQLSGKSATVFRLSQPLWDGGRTAAQIRQTNAKAELAMIAQQETENQLARKLIDLYRAYLIQAGRERVYAEGVRALQDLDGLIQRRVEAGVSADIDASTARVRLVQAQADLSAAQNQKRTVLEQVRILMGEGAPCVLGITQQPASAWGWNTPASLAELREMAQNDQPSLKRLEIQKQVAQSEFDTLKAELQPALSIRYENQTGSYTGSLPAGTRTYIGAQYALGAGASVFPKMASAATRLQAQVEQSEAASQDFMERLLGEWEDLKTLRMRLPQLEQAQQVSFDVTESTRRLFVAGRRSWLELLNVVREQLQAQVTLSDAQAEESTLQYKQMLSAGVALGVPRVIQPNQQ